MKTLKHIYNCLTLFFFFIVLSCDSSILAPPHINAEISVPEGYTNYFIEDILLKNTESETKVAFQTNVPWTISVCGINGENVPWCRISEKSGDAGLHKVIVHTDKNDDYENRCAKIILRAETATAEILVTQECIYSVFLSNKVYNIPCRGDTITVQVNANIDFNYEIINQCSWISALNNNTRALESYSLTFVVDRNHSTDSRIAQIVFSDVDKKYRDTLMVFQETDWEVRNKEFIDSIALLATANLDGRWLKKLNYKLDETDSNGSIVKYDNENYIYCYVEENGNGSKTPQFSDTILVNYRGRLIPTADYPKGKIFDQSFNGPLNPQHNNPVRFCVGEVIVGWSTALLHMKEGDIWRVYIPSNLAYGGMKQNDIPAYSTLIFELSFVDFYPVDS